MEMLIFNNQRLQEGFNQLANMAQGGQDALLGLILNAHRLKLSHVNVNLGERGVVTVSIGSGNNNRIYVKNIVIPLAQPAPAQQFHIVNEADARQWINKEYNHGEEIHRSNAHDLLDRLQANGNNVGAWRNGDRFERFRAGYSLRISEKHRLVFTMQGNNITITSVKDHY